MLHILHKYISANKSMLSIKKQQLLQLINWLLQKYALLAAVCNDAFFFGYSDGCDMRPSEHRAGSHLSHLRGHTLGRLPSHHHEPLTGPNNGKYATLSKQCKTLESSDFY